MKKKLINAGLIALFLLISVTLGADVIELNKESIRIILEDILTEDGRIDREVVSEAERFEVFKLRIGENSDNENIWIEISIPKEYRYSEYFLLPVPWVPMDVFIDDLIFTNSMSFKLLGNQPSLSQYYVPLRIADVSPEGLDRVYVKLAFLDFRAIRDLESSILGDKEAAFKLAEKRILLTQVADHIFFFIGNLLVIVGLISLFIFFVRKHLRDYTFLIFSIMALITGLFHWIFSPFTDFLKMNHQFRFHYLGFFYLILYYLLVIFINLLFKYKRKEFIIFLYSFIITIPLIMLEIIHPISMRYIFTGYIFILFIYTVIQIKNDHRFSLSSKIILALGFSVFLILFILQFFRILERFHMVFSPFGIGIAILSVIFTYFILQHYKSSMMELEEQKIKLIKLEQDQLQSQLNALKNQIDPHFLFNNFGTLISLIEMDQSLAVNFVEELSKVYRFILQIKDKELITLSEELEFTKSYIYLLKQRFRDFLTINIELDKGLMNKFVVPLSLQTLVENACKHNVISEDLPLTISIKDFEDNLIEVRNNYQPKRQLTVTHKIGLDNLKKRFSFFTDNQIFIEQKDKEFIVRIPTIDEIR